MSKEFRPWKIDEAQLLPPSVQDYVPRDHVSRLIVSLVRELETLKLELADARRGGGESSGSRRPVVEARPAQIPRPAAPKPAPVDEFIDISFGP